MATCIGNVSSAHFRHELFLWENKISPNESAKTKPVFDHDWLTVKSRRFLKKVFYSLSVCSANFDSIWLMAEPRDKLRPSDVNLVSASSKSTSGHVFGRLPRRKSNAQPTAVPVAESGTRSRVPSDASSLLLYGTPSQQLMETRFERLRQQVAVYQAKKSTEIEAIFHQSYMLADQRHDRGDAESYRLDATVPFPEDELPYLYKVLTVRLENDHNYFRLIPFILRRVSSTCAVHQGQLGEAWCRVSRMKASCSTEKGTSFFSYFPFLLSCLSKLLAVAETQK